MHIQFIFKLNPVKMRKYYRAGVREKKNRENVIYNIYEQVYLVHVGVNDKINFKKITMML